MKKNTSGFSLVLAMGLVLAVSLLAFVILEYMIPFTRNIKGIENASKSYYQANAGIENALYFLSDSNNFGNNSSDSLVPSLSTDNSYSLVAKGTVMPPIGKGNSSFDSDRNWNRIRAGEPIQIQVGDNKLSTLSDLEIQIRIPNISGNAVILAGDEDETPILNWQISGEQDSLSAYSDGASINTYIKPENIQRLNSSQTFICPGGGTKCDVSFNKTVFKEGRNLSGDIQNFGDFYSSPGDNCTDGKECSLKLSVIGKLETTTGVPLPYLEWKITTPELPLRYAQITAEGKSFGFKKTLEVSVPQQTVIEAFDFTVFQ